MSARYRPPNFAGHNIAPAIRAGPASLPRRVGYVSGFG